MYKISKLSISIIAFSCILLILTSCIGDSKIVYNQIKELNSSAAPYIEGAYNKELDAIDFKELTGIDIQNSLPEKYKNETTVYTASYDSNDELLNISVGIGEENDRCISIAVHSKKLWSDLSYDPIDYVYNEETKSVTIISDVPVIFAHYDDSKSEYKLGYDIYIAKFTINDINIYIESNKLNQNDFESLVKKLIENTNSLE